MLLLDIIGPIMVGPSSSHTAGAVRLGRLARAILGEEPAQVRLTLHGSFAATRRGHGTDLALVAGLLGLDPADERIRSALDLARERELAVEIACADLGEVHPNTVRFDLVSRGGDRRRSVWGSSVGAGRVEVFRIDDMELSLTGDYPALVVFHRDRPGIIAAITAVLATGATNIAHMRVTRDGRGGRALTVLELDQPISPEVVAAVQHLGGVAQALAIPPLGDADNCPLPPAGDAARRPSATASGPTPDVAAEESGRRGFTSLASLVEEAERRSLPLSQVALELDALGQGVTPESIRGAMRERWTVMKRAAQEGLERAPRSRSGLVGGDGRRMEQARTGGHLLAGEVMDVAMAAALGVAEVNAAMGVIVAAPTAGSCGVLPGVLLAVAGQRRARDDEPEEEAVVRGLLTAGAVGAVIASRATLAGAAGGCQAECGAAAAMAAAAAVELAGGPPSACAHAAAFALKGLMGLVCDPVGGLVEVPCVKRNAMAAAVALAAADLALAGVRSVIPPDEVIAALAEVGRCLPTSLRETAQGGLAVTPTGRSCQAAVCGL